MKLDFVQYCDAEFHNEIYRRCNPELGDVLLTKDGANTGNVAINELDEPFSLLSSVCLLKPDRQKVEPGFIFYYLQSEEGFEQITGQMTGAAIKRIILKTIKSSWMPLPPLPEQRRIVAILDEAFAGIATAVANTERNLANARELFKSYLNSVFSQRGDPIKSAENTTGWKNIELERIFAVGSSKRVLKSQWRTSGVPFYRGREVTKLASAGSVDNELFISEKLFSEFKLKYGVPEAGDILITAIGTIGNSYIVKPKERFYFKDASVLWLSKRSDNDSKFVNYWLRSDSFKGQLEKGNGATVDTLTIGKLKHARICIPGLPEQKRFVAILDDLSAETSSLEFIYQQKLTALDELKQSLLQKAFSGELTADTERLNTILREEEVA